MDSHIDQTDEQADIEIDEEELIRVADWATECKK